MTSNILIFFIIFELRLIPIFILILGWGYQPERTYARLIIFLYTLFISLPLLLIIVYINDINLINLNFNNKFLILSNRNLFNFFFSLFFFLAFLVKLPIFIFHSWLAQAHVEASVERSIVLASLILKLGGLGLLRLNSFFFILNSYLVIIFILSFIGIVFILFLCYSQLDLKLIIAYSSVSHIALIILAWAIQRKINEIVLIIIIVSHGFTSSTIFFLRGILYKNSKSRNLFFNKGLQFYQSITRFIWFIVIIWNIAGPPSINLFLEIVVILNLIIFIKLFFVFFFISLFINVLFNINIYILIRKKRKNLSLKNYHFLKRQRKLILINHLFIFRSLTFLIWLFFSNY